MDSLQDPSFPGRPTHPDFWKLSEIILQMDGKFAEDAPTDFEEFIDKEIDPTSIIYMAIQRADRLQGRNVGSIAALYMEAFIVGRRFERRYGGPRG